MLLPTSKDDLLEAVSHVIVTEMHGEPHLVINIRDIHNKLNIESKEIPHDSPDDVGRDIVSSMTKVGVIIDCWPTGIPCHNFIIDRHERSLASSQGVVNFQGRCIRNRLRSLPWRLRSCTRRHAP